VEFDILSGYNPLPAAAKDHEQEQKDAAQKVAANQDKPVKSSVHKTSDNNAAGHKTVAAISLRRLLASAKTVNPAAKGGAR